MVRKVDKNSCKKLAISYKSTHKKDTNNVTINIRTVQNYKEYNNMYER